MSFCGLLNGGGGVYRFQTLLKKLHNHNDQVIHFCQIYDGCDLHVLFNKLKNSKYFLVERYNDA